MQKARISGGFVVLLAVLCLLPSSGWAASTTLPTFTCTGSYSPGDLQTYISTTLTAATGNNATLPVTGNCTENLTVPWADFTLEGGGSATITAGSANSSVVTVAAPLVTIEGFTISGGTDGVLVANSASAIIENNTISTGSTATHAVVVRNCASAYIAGNTISGFPDAGIVVRENSSAHIGFIKDSDTTANANTIENNSPGIRVFSNSSATIVGNTIANNTGNGIEVDKVSQADIADNTIDTNSLNGIYVAGNSGVNLGAENPGTIFYLPNYTDTSSGDKNTKYGIACATPGYVAGFLGSLTGAKGPTSLAGCSNALQPIDPSAELVGSWNVTGHYSPATAPWSNPPTALTFAPDGTGTGTSAATGSSVGTTPGATFTFAWTLTGSTLAMTITNSDNSITNLTGKITWSGIDNVTYKFNQTTPTPVTGRIVNMTRQP